MSKKTEARIQSEILLATPRDARMFRNNVGMGWVGRTIELNSVADLNKLRPLLANGVRIKALVSARPLHAGLCAGSPDLVGWSSVVVDEQMIGQKLAVFTGIEIKAAKGKAREQQKKFLDVMREAGAKGGIARSVEEALEFYPTRK